MAKSLKQGNKEPTRDEKGNLTAEYITNIVNESINQNPLVYKRLSKI
ncbi:MAG: hypothetical protein ABJB85_03040 [Nitrososphaerota archaeon]